MTTEVADLPQIAHWDLALRLRCDWAGCQLPATHVRFQYRKDGSPFLSQHFRCTDHPHDVVTISGGRVEAFRL